MDVLKKKKLFHIIILYTLKNPHLIEDYQYQEMCILVAVYNVTYRGVYVFKFFKCQFLHLVFCKMFSFNDDVWKSFWLMYKKIGISLKLYKMNHVN